MVSFFRNPRDPQNIETIKTLKSWVREITQLSDSETIIITEIQCYEPTCPGIETSIHIIKENGQKYSYQIPKPLVYVRRPDLVACLS